MADTIVSMRGGAASNLWEEVKAYVEKQVYSTFYFYYNSFISFLRFKHKSILTVPTYQGWRLVYFQSDKTLAAPFRSRHTFIFYFSEYIILHKS